MPSATYGLHKLGINRCISYRILTDLYECLYSCEEHGVDISVLKVGVLCICSW
jgi:hypothetical protein